MINKGDMQLFHKSKISAEYPRQRLTGVKRMHSKLETCHRSEQIRATTKRRPKPILDMLQASMKKQ